MTALKRCFALCATMALLVVGLVPALAFASSTTADGFEYVTADGAAQIVSYQGTSATPKVPATLDGLPVTMAVFNRANQQVDVTSVDLSAAAGTLKSLKTYGNPLTSIDLTGCSALTYLDVRENDLVELNLHDCTALKELRCGGNQLKGLDLTANTVLGQLYCENNQIATLNVAACAKLYYLDCSYNALTTLNVDANVYLYDLYAHHNRIVTGLYALTQRYGTEEGVILPQDTTVPTDTTALGTAVDAAKQVERGLYTQASWTVFQEALSAAEAQLATPGTQDEVDGATATLTTAQAALTRADAVQFPDVTDQGQWYYERVYRASDLGLITGYSNGRFGPNDTLNRAQAAVILWRYYAPDEAAAYDQDAAKNDTGMSDVNDGDWYTGAANWAVREGVISGKGEGSARQFDPNGKITREQLCAIVANAAAKYKGADVEGASQDKLNSMPDQASVSSWARSSVAWSLNEGVISGKGSGAEAKVAPADSVTRAEMATIITNALDNGLL